MYYNFQIAFTASHCYWYCPLKTHICCYKKPQCTNRSKDITRERNVHFVITGFCSEADENCVLLRYYAASTGNSLPTFLDNFIRTWYLNGIDRLSRNVGNELPLIAAKWPRRRQFSACTIIFHSVLTPENDPVKFTVNSKY